MESEQLSRPRRPGNTIHPTIRAMGRRILSQEQQTSPLAVSPRVQRRDSAASSSVQLGSGPITPLRLSPQPASAMPSTPRSGSPRSWRLSDEEASVGTDSWSVDAETGLVMPSIAVSARHPLTERGQQLGRIKVMVVGRRGVGKSSLIRSIVRASEDVVHSTPAAAVAEYPDVWEVRASTRTYPDWWKERGCAMGEGVLEPNLCLVDTPGVEDERGRSQIMSYFAASHPGHLDELSELETLKLLSGEGGTHVDAVLWLFAHDEELSCTASKVIRHMSLYTNIIPVIGFADTCADVQAAKRRMIAQLAGLPSLYSLQDKEEPYAISSAAGIDDEELDASVLMSSLYEAPPVPSDLGKLVARLLDPSNAARMRHTVAAKFVGQRAEKRNGRLGGEFHLDPDGVLPQLMKKAIALALGAVALGWFYVD
ncbi:hypothetical protein K470DRAFT_292847 [Piedraia hortae CBS 480.64]|uniref:Septin-type G domain-containing protein n=1 Tax=Piedraia hortae CBS 480.64 TaxID=1314780 RepID=A0A6A7C7I1_9PEZI|nr:hypothetical protein K470DRAFT_292847 [Piedraia hortae CBS 480.64]